MRQRHWVELLKDYNCTIEYYLEKANVVMDALNRKSSGSLYYIHTVKMPLLIKLRKLDAEFRVDTPPGVLATLKIRLLLMERILAAQ